MRPLAISLALALAGCGSVYDAAGLRALGPASPPPGGGDPGGGLTCDPGTVRCGEACAVEDASHCGASCQACAAPFAGAVAACVAGACSHACDDGLLACNGGCCAAAAVSAGAGHTCAIAAGTGELFCWGANDAGQLGLGDRADRAKPALVPGVAGALAVAAGGAHTCALVAGGQVRCWGAVAASPVTSGASAIAAGATHACAIVSGAVSCWGSGAGAVAPALSGVTAVAAGGGFSCAATASGVRCWGALPDGPALAASALAAGGGHACAATEGGLLCWGDNSSAQLGTNNPAPTLAPTLAARLPNGAGVVAAGGAFTCALKTPNASFKCAGANGAAQLGSGLAIDNVSDVAFGANVNAIAAGGEHGCAVAGGALSCWGSNARGQLGTGSSAATSPPAKVSAR